MSFPRRFYRTGQRQRYMIVTVTAPDGTTAEGEVQDLSANGTGAIFANGEAPGLVAGDVVELAFDAFLLMEPVVALAIVRGRREREEHTRLSFEFTDPNTVLAQVPYVMQREFNRRANPRVPVEKDVEISFTSLGHPSGATGTLIDLSKGGLGMQVTEDVGSKLAIGHRLEMRCTLGDRQVKLQLTATARNLRSASGHIFCGVQFERLDSEDSEAQWDAIEAYVGERLKSAPPSAGPNPWSGPGGGGSALS